MREIFRIFEFKDGILTKIAFVESLESTLFFLESSNIHKRNLETFYFAQKIRVQK